MPEPIHERILLPMLNRLFSPKQSGAEKQFAAPRDALFIGHSLPLEAEQLPVRGNGGVTHELEKPVCLAPAERRIHVYALGRSGSGKTTLLLKLIADDLMARRSIVVIDLRGDLVERVLVHTAALGLDDSEIARRLWLLDLREREWSVPLAAEDGKHADSPHERALLVLEVLRNQAESWGVQLEETTRNVLLALATVGDTLLHVEPLLTDTAYRQNVVAQVSDPSVRGFFARYDAMKPERQNEWRAAVFNKVTPLLAEPSVRRALGQGDALPLRRILDETPGSILLISLASDKLHGAARLIGSLLLSQLETAITARADRPEKQRVPVSLFVDEFENFAGERFGSLLAEGRRFGLSLVLSHQNLTQLPTALRAAVRSNAGTQFLFGVGAPDATELSSEVSDALDSSRSDAALPAWQKGGGKAKESARKMLLSQGMGETFLLRRAQPLVRLRVQALEEPQVATGEIQRLRLTSFVAHARPASRADALLRQASSPATAFPKQPFPPTPAKPPARVSPPTVSTPTVSTPTPTKPVSPQVNPVPSSSASTATSTQPVGGASANPASTDAAANGNDGEANNPPTPPPATNSRVRHNKKPGRFAT